MDMKCVIETGYDMEEGCWMDENMVVDENAYQEYMADYAKDFHLDEIHLLDENYEIMKGTGIVRAAYQRGGMYDSHGHPLFEDTDDDVHEAATQMVSATIPATQAKSA